jgi:hypothetical protein
MVHQRPDSNVLRCVWIFRCHSILEKIGGGVLYPSSLKMTPKTPNALYATQGDELAQAFSLMTATLGAGGRVICMRPCIFQ